MIVVTLKGGLGNQMFQYAAAKALALKHNTGVCIDQSFLNANPGGQWTKREYELSVFPALRNLNEYSLLNKISGKISPRKRFTETGLTYDKQIEYCGSDVHLEGYFQSDKYFLRYANEIKEDFAFPVPLSEANRFHLRELYNTSGAISVHVRRGDMVTLKSANDHHGTLSREYYHTAFETMRSLYGKDLLYFVFSDDQEWAKANIIPPGRVVYVDSIPGRAVEDMNLMSVCQHHVVANSSFSWWGAWLGSSSNKTVIAPKNWFRDSVHDTSDLLPEHWIRL